MRVRREIVEASAWVKFRLLMWKNFLQQWRHPKQTFIELLLPVATMSLVLVLRQQIEPVQQETLTYPPIQAHSLNFSMPVIATLNFRNLSLAYSPQSPILDDVVRSAMVNLFALNLKDILSLIAEQEINIPDIPIDIPLDLNTTAIYEIAKRLVRIAPYNSSSQLRSIYSDEQDIRRVIAAIEFDDNLLGVTSLPNNMSYAIRFPERPRLNSFLDTGGRNWRSDMTFPLFELPGPRFPYSWEGGNDPGYINEMFIAVQNSISMEIISRISGSELRTFDIHLQRYPHPSYLEDLAVGALIFIFPLFFMLSFTYTAVNIIRSVTLEKELQLKETMKVMGLNTWLHWTAWFFKQMIYLIISIVLIVILLKVNWFTNEQGYSGYAVFTNTPWTVLFFYVTIYLCCTVFFCFMVSTFFSKASTAALCGGVLWFMTYIPAVLLGADVEVPLPIQAITCLSINSAMSFGFQLMLGKENSDGMQWGEFFTTHSVDSNKLLFGHICILLVVDSILYMLVALYMEQVLPGPFGAPKPWYFPFQKSFWFPPKKVIYDDTFINNTLTDDTIKEEDPTNLDIGVKIINLTKTYGNNIAVNNLNLNIYDDQITVLLGHNGAGKSTTISMLTGNVEISQGGVWVAGYNVSTQTSLARSHLGVCPQHNVIFNELSVREHLEFFSRLKGYSGKELDDEIDNLIDRLEMQEKRHYLASGLSGGQKRRLCVGIALSGGPRVVILDEPTSGMDPSSRRALWDLLQKEKKGRSLILTTHFMDEADYLGDRVAIMSSGRLQCVGSPYFLKRHYGVGYTLVIVKNQDFQAETCTAVIDKYIPGTIITEDRGKEVTYKLPNDYSHVFEDLLNDLENNVHYIQFKNYGLIATTLEDVFMSVGSDVEVYSESEDTTMSADSRQDVNIDEISLEDCKSLDSLELPVPMSGMDKNDENETGLRLLWLHVSGVWLKLFLVWKRSWGLLTLQILVPIVLVNLSLGILQYLVAAQSSVMSRPLTLATGYRNTETLLSFNGTSSSSFGSLATESYKKLYDTADTDLMKLTFTGGQSISDYYLERTSDAEVMASIRKKLLIGATFDDNSATAWFSNFGYHDVATSLATVHEAILKSIDPSAILKVYNHPLEANYRDNIDLQLMVSLLSSQVSGNIGNALAIISAVYVMFYIKERVTRAKLLQRAAGMRPDVMWGAAAVFDWFWFSIASVTVIISCAAFQVIGFSTTAELGRLYLVIIIYGAAMLPLHYLFSLLINTPALGFVIMFFVNILFGLIGAQIVEALSLPNLKTGEAARIMDYILPLFPLYSAATSMRKINQIRLTEHSCLHYCDYAVSIFPNITECTMDALCENFSSNCCIRSNPFFEWEHPGILRYIVCTLASGALFWILLIVIEYGWLKRFFTRERKDSPHESSIDPDVVDEAKHAMQVDKNSSDVALVARGLTKYYKNHLAVDQISFTVSQAECFGLLGVNGAGKTTTFKMLMGDENISSGDAFVSGDSVKTNLTKVYTNIGYCPQFDAIFGELTGRETLYLFSRFRGLKYSNSSLRAESLANALGFSKHIDKRVDQYSGGNKRKLSTAVAMLGKTRLIFVDEPTTGVDPAAKRQVWRAVRQAREAGRAFVLTSHSMEECEALCSRLTIMVNGRFQCIGSPQHLKNKYSEGFTLTIKMRTTDSVTQSSTETTTTESKLAALKHYVATNYNNVKLMEEYQGMLTFYLPDRSTPWSKMFGIMEKAKRELDVEDYSILQTTLEQIFLQFTKYQKEGRQV